MSPPIERRPADFSSVRRSGFLGKWDMEFISVALHRMHIRDLFYNNYHFIRSKCICLNESKENFTSSHQKRWLLTILCLLLDIATIIIERFNLLFNQAVTVFGLSAGRTFELPGQAKFSNFQLRYLMGSALNG
jgi:hypothetical protein